MPQSISLTSAQSAPAVELDGEDKSWQDMAPKTRLKAWLAART